MRELIEFVARSLVDEPAAVQVRERQTDGAVVFELYVAGPDVGKVMTRGGSDEDDKKYRCEQMQSELYNWIGGGGINGRLNAEPFKFEPGLGIDRPPAKETALPAPGRSGSTETGQ